MTRTNQTDSPAVQPLRPPASRLAPRGVRHARHARRGSIYAVVLGMAILVALIGMSAVAAGRVNLRVASTGSEGGDADLLALSAVEHAAATINTEALWRTNYSSGAKAPAVALGRGSFTWKLVDEADGNLSSGGLQPIRIWGYGHAGEASRCYSVVMTPGGANVALNPGAESGLTGYEVQGADCTLESASDGPHSGTRSLLVKNRTGRTGGPQQTLTGKIISGYSYYVEALVKMATTPEEPWVCLVVRQPGTLGLTYSDTVFKARAQSAGTEWTRVSGTVTPSWTGTVDAVFWRMETNSTGQNFKIDDLRIVQSGALTPMAPAAETWRQEPVP